VTDGQTDGHGREQRPRLRIASRGKNRPLFTNSRDVGLDKVMQWNSIRDEVMETAGYSGWKEMEILTWICDGTRTKLCGLLSLTALAISPLLFAAST